MGRDAPTTAYTEVQIDDDSISLTLISEGESGPVIEDTERFTFEELQSLAGNFSTLRLSDESRSALDSQREDAAICRMEQADDLSEKAEEISDEPSSDELLAYMGLLGGEATDGQETGQKLQTAPRPMPDAGQHMVDENAPSWSEDDRVVVQEVLSDVRADHYVIQGYQEMEVVQPTDQYWNDKSVAQANPSYPEDDSVVIATYEGSTKEYAFPESRLKYPDCDAPIDDI